MKKINLIPLHISFKISILLIAIIFANYPAKSQLSKNYNGEVETIVNDSRFRMVQTYMKNGDYLQAEELIAQLYINEKSTPVIVEYIKVLELQKKYSKAIEVLENYESLSDKKNNSNKGQLTFEIRPILAKYYWLNGKKEIAEEIWSKSIDDNKNNPYIYELIADIQLTLQLPEKSANTLIISRKNLSLPYLFGEKIIKIYVSSNLFEDGIKEIINLFDYNNNNRNGNEEEINDDVFGTIIYRNQPPIGNNNNGKTTAEQFVIENNSRLNLNSVKGRISSFPITEKSKMIFTDYLESLSNKNEKNVYVQDLYAWYLKSINSKDVFDVYIKLDKIRNTQGRMLLQLADESRIDTNFTLALKSYEYVLDLGKKLPNYQNALFGYILTKEKVLFNKYKSDNFENFEKVEVKSSFDKIINDYLDFLKEIPNSNNSVEAKFNIANIYKITKRYDLAQNEYENIIKTYAKTGGVGKAYLELADLFIYKGDLNGAELQINSLFKSSRLDQETMDLAMFKRANLLFYKGEIPKADSIFKQLSNSTDKNISNDALENSFLIQKNEKFPTDLVTFAKAELLQIQNKYDEAVELFLKINEDETEKDIAELSLIEIAKIKTNQNKLVEAIGFLDKVEKRNIYSTNNDTALLLKAKIQISLNQKNEAVETLKTILNRYPYTIYLQEVRELIRNLRDNS